MSAVERCGECGGPLATRKVQKYRNDELLGIPGVVLIDVAEEDVCKSCGQVDGVTIPNLNGLLSAVALARLSRPEKLTGRELRFVRRVIGWKAENLANAISVTRESVSRWENGKEPIGPTTEKLIRIVAGLHITESAAAPLVEFDTQKIEAMKLIPARSTSRPLELRFKLVEAETGQDGRTGAYAAIAA